MKKIVVLVVGLLVINSSFIMGMEPKREGFISEYIKGVQKDCALQRQRTASPSSSTSLTWSGKELETYLFSFSKFFSSMMAMMVLSTSQTSDTANCKETVCFDSTMINFLWVMLAATTVASSYEMYNRKPLFASPKKSALLSVTNYSASAVSLACYSMVNDCPDFSPKCTQMRQALCGLNVLAATGVVVSHVLNKQN